MQKTETIMFSSNNKTFAFELLIELDVNVSGGNATKTEMIVSFTAYEVDRHINQKSNTLEENFKLNKVADIKF
jgi:hypothetical protein